MLIIFGIRTTLRLLGIVTVTCRGCGNPAAQRVEERRRTVTLFFVPILPIGRKTLLTCTFCARTSEVPDDEVHRLLQHAHDVRDRGGPPTGPRPETLPGGGRGPEHP